jgi:CheY-like chemotaxis protein
MPKILIIDDSRLSRNMLSDPLLEFGFTVVQAENGQEGLDAFAAHNPDCVITDLLMPVMTGQEFIRELRGKDTAVPVLVLSSDIQETSEAECQALGISKFLNKPVNADQIVNDVNEAIKQTGVLQ